MGDVALGDLTEQHIVTAMRTQSATLKPQTVNNTR